MIARTSRAKSGLSVYLKSGKKAESEYLRNEKDNVIPLYGNLNTFERAENFTNKHKEWEYNYTHITIGFSKEDMQRLDELNEDDKKELLHNISLDYIKHHTSGYDLDNEVIAFSEVHEPKIKFENGKERFEHIHIGISHWNPLSDTKLRTTFATNSFIDDTFQTYINKKYNLTQPRDYVRSDREKPFNSKTGIERKELAETLKNIKSKAELESFFKDNDISFREVKTDKNHYYKVINSKGKDINLRGKGFEHLEAIAQNKYDKSFQEENLQKSMKDLESVLDSYYQKRFEEIDKRRSVKTKEDLANIYAEEADFIKTEEQKQKDSYKAEYPNLTDKDKPKTYQEKIFYKHYKDLIRTDLKGYYIDIKDEKNVKFVNKSKKIDVVDKGKKIISNNKVNNTKEEVALMLDIALAKKWDLATLKMEGNKEFQDEVKRQIVERLKEKELKKETLPLTEAERPRPTTSLQHEIQEIENKQLLIQSEQQTDIKLIKTDLNAQTVLDYAIEKYKLNRADYELTNDNQINNLNNRQKPKNTIDFLQAECHLSTKESITVNRDLFSKQTQSKTIKEEKEFMAMNISICKDTNKNALNKWEVKEVKTYSDLEDTLKTYPYSSSQFDKYRNKENTKGFNNVMIFDIDNDKYSKELSIKEAEQLLKDRNISAMIITSRSHNIDKKVGKDTQIKANVEVKEEYHKAERYRVVIPTQQALSSDTDIDTFREYNHLIAKDLGFEKYTDKSAQNDKARLYYKSPEKAKAIIIKSDTVLDSAKFEKQAIQNVKERREQIEKAKAQNKVEREARRLEAPKANDSDNLTFANYEKIQDIEIKPLIENYEKGESYQEGSYHIYETDNAKYSLFQNDNLAHDFKTAETYNTVQYLQKQYNTKNLNQIANELEKETGESYTEVNFQAVERAINKAREGAKNDKEFEDSIKQSFNVKYCKLEKDNIKIANKEIMLDKVNTNKKELVSSFQKNREQENKKSGQRER